MANYNFKVENLDCANCASKIETAISKLDGIESCSVNFLTQKVRIQAEELSQPLFEQILKIAKKIEHDIKFTQI